MPPKWFQCHVEASFATHIPAVIRSMCPPMVSVSSQSLMILRWSVWPEGPRNPFLEELCSACQVHRLHRKSAKARIRQGGLCTLKIGREYPAHFLTRRQKSTADGWTKKMSAYPSRRNDRNTEKLKYEWISIWICIWISSIAFLRF